MLDIVNLKLSSPIDLSLRVYIHKEYICWVNIFRWS